MDWPKLAREKLAEFRECGDGWCFGEGVTFPESTFASVAGIMETAEKLGLSEYEVFPSILGHIEINLYRHGNRELVLKCKPEFDRENHEKLKAFAA